MTKIFIDPGHGGSDPGAVGNGLMEKNKIRNPDSLRVGIKLIYLFSAFIKFT